jgi:hypothetical protein
MARRMAAATAASSSAGRSIVGTARIYSAGTFPARRGTTCLAPARSRTHAQYTHRAFEDSPAGDDADEKITAGQRRRAPSGTDLHPDARDERFEAGKRDALGGETVVARGGANGGPTRHERKTSSPSGVAVKPNRLLSLTAAVLILPGIAGGRQGPVHPRPASSRNAVLVRQQGFGRRSAYGLRSDYLAQMTCSTEEFAIPRRA